MPPNSGMTESEVDIESIPMNTSLSMTKLRLALLLVTLALVRDAGAQERIAGEAVVRKQATAMRVGEGAIRVDGRLDDESWRQAIPITDFVQKEPDEGVQPTEGMDLRVVYDDSAIYFGVRLHKSPERQIQAPMGRRDGVEEQAEYVMVALDTFQDRRTAYAFGVTATGVRIDRFYPQDDETNFDEGFDPVWEARTTTDDSGWSAELWIPFSQLRFNDLAEQAWGLNVQRSTPSINELDYWVAVPRTQKGWASHFGDLTGIVGVRPTRRLELLPYVAGASTVNANRDLANPFDDGRNLTSRFGGDLKMGIGPNLTLEATMNPDFGQVEADPAVVNLTAFETFFTEKRPFFTEGASLLNMSNVNNFFYSRRIGAPPVASVSGDFVDYPSTSTIIAAGKLTGRFSSGTSLGAIAALTDSESARVFDLDYGTIGKVRVAPRTSYGLVRVVQEFGVSRSTVSAMATAVHRNFVANDPLSALLPENAFSVASDSLLRFKGGQYELFSYGGFTYVGGEPGAISRIQRSAVHYLQRPDRTYARFDPTRTSLAGYKAGGIFERTGGRHWLWNVNTDFEPATLDTNDIGRLSAGDGIRLSGTLRYRETVPGRMFRNYQLSVSQNNEWNFAGMRQGGSARANLTLTFLNFWTATLSTGPNMRFLDGRLTRGGPLMRAPGGWLTTATLRNRASAETVWNGSLTRSIDELGGGRLNVNGGLSFRPGPRWQLSVTPAYTREVGSQQYVTSLDGGRPETYDRRYIFSFIERSTVSTQLRTSYTFKPDLNLDVYAEPFAASGRYYDFGELAEPRALHLRFYGTAGTTIALQPDGSRVVTDGTASFPLKNSDFNVRSFRSNVVLRWEWRPGSTLYIVWQQDREISETLSGRVGAGDMFRSLSAPGSNFFAVKTSFWLPVR
jgi:hypothetical protein